jgi:hypothetical protein
MLQVFEREIGVPYINRTNTAVQIRPYNYHADGPDGTVMGSVLRVHIYEPYGLR